LLQLALAKACLRVSSDALAPPRPATRSRGDARRAAKYCTLAYRRARLFLVPRPNSAKLHLGSRNAIGKEVPMLSVREQGPAALGIFAYLVALALLGALIASMLV